MVTIKAHQSRCGGISHRKRYLLKQDVSCSLLIGGYSATSTRYITGGRKLYPVQKIPRITIATNVRMVKNTTAQKTPIRMFKNASMSFTFLYLFTGITRFRTIIPVILDQTNHITNISNEPYRLQTLSLFCLINPATCVLSEW